LRARDLRPYRTFLRPYRTFLRPYRTFLRPSMFPDWFLFEKFTLYFNPINLWKLYSFKTLSN